MLPAGSPPRLHDHENRCPGFNRPPRCHWRTSIEGQDSYVGAPRTPTLKSSSAKDSDFLSPSGAPSSETQGGRYGRGYKAHPGNRFRSGDHSGYGGCAGRGLEKVARLRKWLGTACYSRAMREVVAKRIFELARNGVEDREALVTSALKFVAANYEPSGQRAK
jgi:hypothetical protein